MSQSDGDRVIANDRDHVFHSWSAQQLISPVAVAGAEGCWFWDYADNRYLDFASQLVNANIGHQHPRVVAAIQAQAATLCTIAPFHANDKRGELARMIAEVAPEDLNKVFFTSGGAEATENAVRLARLHTGRLKVLSFYRSYHGATAGAIGVTGDPRRWPNEPAIPGVVHFFGPYSYRSAFASTSEAQECERALDHLEQVIILEGPQTVAAVMIEPVVGTNGVLVPPDGYLAGVRDICNRYGIVFIADEVMSGFGRCGEWFAVDRWQVSPDLITFAKGVNSGYVPLGGVVISDDIAATFATRPFPGGLTYSGHPLGCASGVESMTVFREEGLLEHVRALEPVLEKELGSLASRHPCVGEVRGVGLMWAVELVRDQSTREPLVPFNASGDAAAPMNALVGACKKRGLWPFAHFNRIHVVPPIIISEEELHQGLSILDEALSVGDSYTG